MDSHFLEGVAAVLGEEPDSSQPGLMHCSCLRPLLSPLPALRPAPRLSVGSKVDRFFLFSLSPVHWLGLLLGIVSVSLAGVGVGREKEGQERKWGKG